jgi:NADPH-dependent 2,4-dienoyl-CoA reductase/sulfur reductase-like enzyme
MRDQIAGSTGESESLSSYSEKDGSTTIMKGYEYTIIGGGVVAGYAARELVDQGITAGDLGIISADNQAPYDRPPLSKGFLAGSVGMDEILINDAEFYNDHFIGVRLEDPVVAIDFEQRTLQTRANNVYGFEKLLIATGAQARTFDLPGSDLNGICTLRSLDDARTIRLEMEQADRAVVIGGGFIGMEIASQFADKEIATTLVFPEEHLMAELFTPQMSDYFEAYYRDRGVDFVSGAQIESFSGDENVSSVMLRSGRELETDVVVAGIGVEPSVDVFEDSGLQLENGIVVNEYLETNIPNVYAAGDVANYYDVIFEKRRRIEHWDNAAAQGKYAAKVMTGQQEPFEKVPYFFSDIFDLSWEFWGDTEGADRVVHRGEVGLGSFSTWWFKKNRVVAAFIMNRPDEERQLAPTWIKNGRRVSQQALADEAGSIHEALSQVR